MRPTAGSPPLVFVALVGLIAAACGDDSLTAPQPEPDQLGPSAPSFDIDDGSHGPMTIPGFSWLPPTVMDGPKIFGGTFDGTLLTLSGTDALKIEICKIDGDDPADPSDCVGPILKTLSGPEPPENIRVDTDAENYSVTWRSTDGTDFLAGMTYRAFVGVASRVLGYVDLVATAERPEARNVPAGSVGFVVGQPFHFKFRIETGVPGAVVVSPTTPSIKDTEMAILTATITDLHGAVLSGVTVDWTIDNTSIATLAPTSGLTNGFGETTTTATPAGTLGTTTVRAATQGVAGTTTLSVAPSHRMSISTSEFHSCGVTVEGKAYCWGFNGYGRLGIGHSYPNKYVGPVAVTDGFFGPQTFQSVSAGGGHTCALTTGGEVYCWGLNADGQLGTGYANPQTSDKPLRVTGDPTFQSVSAGDRHTCGVTTEGEAYCWGWLSGSNAPEPVPGGLTFQSVSAGDRHTCGVTADGKAYCWGQDYDGQLGNGALSHSAAPVAVAGGLTFQSVNAGRYHTCGVTSGGDAYCWGRGEDGQLGDGAQTASEVPVAVAGGLTFQSVDVGWEYTCGVTTTGEAYCWGFGWLGHPDLGLAGYPDVMFSTVPVVVAGGLTFREVSAGIWSACGVTEEGAAFCWGRNFAGELGNGTLSPSPAPSAVAGGLTF